MSEADQGDHCLHFYSSGLSPPMPPEGSVQLSFQTLDHVIYGRVCCLQITLLLPSPRAPQGDEDTCAISFILQGSLNERCPLSTDRLQNTAFVMLPSFLLLPSAHAPQVSFQKFMSFFLHVMREAEILRPPTAAPSPIPVLVSKVGRERPSTDCPKSSDDLLFIYLRLMTIYNATSWLPL